MFSLLESENLGKVTGTSSNILDVLKSNWSPFLFKNSWRNGENFQATSLLVYDIDKDISIEEMQHKIGNLVNYIIAPTTNHQKDKVSGSKTMPACDRFRLIFRLSAEITDPLIYKTTWYYYMDAIGFPVDEQCKDLARYYKPSISLESFTESNIDKLDPITNIKLLPLLQEKYSKSSNKKSATSATSAPKTSSAKGRLSRATKEFLLEGAEAGDWHGAFFKAAVDMKEQGYERDEAAELLRKASPEFELDSNDEEQLDDVYNNRGGALEKRIEWPDMIPADKHGTVFKPNPQSQANIRYVITELEGIKLSENTRSEKILIQLKNEPERILKTSDVSNIRMLVQKYGLTVNLVEDMINVISSENPVDPLVDAFKQLPKWDGKPRIQELFNTLKICESIYESTKELEEANILYGQMLRRWLIGVVTKVMNPGSENNVLILHGEQAAGKSRWLKRLADVYPAGWGEGQIDTNNKDHDFRHVDNLIWHVAEFDATTSQREVGALKDYFTKSVINARRPYARFATEASSVCSFCASVNSFDFLHDTTGNRRYLVIPITKADANHGIDMLQVYAEAKAAYVAGERQWFNQKEIERVNAFNDYFISKDERLSLIERFVEPGDDWLTIRQILTEMGLDGRDAVTKAARSQMHSALMRKGIKYGRRGTSGTFAVDREMLSKAYKSTKSVDLGGMGIASKLSSKQLN